MVRIPFDLSAANTYQRWVDALLDRDPRRSGENNFICPAHDDQHPSLTVTAKDDKVLIYCHAGCTAEEVVEALGMTTADLFKDGRGSRSTAPPPGPLPTDLDLQRWRKDLRANAVRLRYLTKERMIPLRVLDQMKIGWDETKQAYAFPHYRADGKLLNVKMKNGKRVWWAASGHTVNELWPASQLDSEFIVLGEGELDVLLLIAQGLPAVTVPNGAGQGKWHDAWAASFTGKAVAIITDCDAPGRTMALEAARSISLAKPARLKVIDLDPSRSDGYDVTDWFREHDGDREQFDELLRAAPDFNPWDFAAHPGLEAKLLRAGEQQWLWKEAGVRLAAVGFVAPPQTGSMADELAIEEPETDWVVAGLHIEGHNTIVVATRKTGKTTLGQNVVRSLADGKPFLGHAVAPLPPGRTTAYLNLEMDRHTWQRWFRDLGVKHPERVFAQHLRGHPLAITDPAARAWLVDWLRSINAAWLIIDSWRVVMAACGLDENVNADVNRVTELIDEIKQDAGVPNCLVIVHASPKAIHADGQEHSRGATALEDWADSFWYLTKLGETRFFRAEGRDVLVPEQTIAHDPATRRLGPRDGGSRAEYQLEERIRKVGEVVARTPGLSHNGLREALHMSRGYADKAIAGAVSRGEVRFEEQGQAHLYYPGDPDRFRVKVPK
jgi:hypothetical protein